MRKKIFFEEEENAYAKLKIRLFYDKLKQGVFFREVVSMYTSLDPDMCRVVEKIKLKNKAMGKKKLQKTRSELISGRELEADLGLSDEERESLYDIIEESRE